MFDVKKTEDKVLISLQQEDRRRSKKVGKGDNIIIGFEIFKVGTTGSEFVLKPHLILANETFGR